MPALQHPRGWLDMQYLALAFLIELDEQPVLMTELKSSSKNPQTHPDASSSQLLKESGEGRIELTF